MWFLSFCFLRSTGLSSPADSKNSRENVPASSSDLTGVLNVWSTNFSYLAYRWKEQEFIDRISGLEISLGGE